MSKFEILCVTMHQNDFSKVKEMNIHSDVVFANQCDHTSYEEIVFEGHTAKMISTQTRGVGVNRNFALTYASAKYCLLADDDVVYFDNLEEIVVSEFEAHQDADIMIFHFNSDDLSRQQTKYYKTKMWHRYRNLPFGGVRIAFRLDSVKKANVMFTTLFGGGCVFPSGEDSMFLSDLRKKGLKIYVSKETIGNVSFSTSTWFSGYDEKYYYGKGALYQAARPKYKYVFMFYMIFRSRKMKNISVKDKLIWMLNGMRGYRELLSYNQFKELYKLT